MRNANHDCDSMNDPLCLSGPVADPWETDFAALVPRFTGSISAISSALIIYVILRSKTGLSSIYHRIMFGMSLADTFGSVAMALTSLPMPSYMPSEEVFGYHWAGARLGNTATCNIQGFFVFFVIGCVSKYNAMLCVYYACAIAFTMREKNIKKYVEPFLHGIPILTGIAFSVPPLFSEMYNPGVSAYAWCGPQPYPDECSLIDGIKCIRGSREMKRVSQNTTFVVITVVFVLIVTSLVLVVWKVVQTDHVMKQISKLYRDRGNPEMENVLQRHRNTKAVVIQASCYIAAYLLVVTPPILLSFGAIDSSGKRGPKDILIADTFEKLILVFVPLQGFMNFIIFISHKVYNHRRVHRDVSICRVLGLLFCTSSHEPFFISRISMVKENNENQQLGIESELGEESKEVKGMNGFELDLQDESNQELRYRLALMNIGSSGPESPLHVVGSNRLEDTSEVEEGVLAMHDYASSDIMLLPSPSKNDDAGCDQSLEKSHCGSSYGSSKGSLMNNCSGKDVSLQEFSIEEQRKDVKKYYL